MEKSVVGYIYVLTNPSFPEYIKIGYADDIEKRLKQLNRSECVPYSFVVYAYLPVAERLSDLSVHRIIDRFKPELRCIERDQEGHTTRVREFYAMAAEEAVELLEDIAGPFGARVVRVERTQKEQAEQIEANEVASELTKKNRSAFSFGELNIPVGSILTYTKDETVTCKVLDNWHVEYNGNQMSLTALAKILLNKVGQVGGVNGTKYFKYRGKTIWNTRMEREKKSS